MTFHLPLPRILLLCALFSSCRTVSVDRPFEENLSNSSLDQSKQSNPLDAIKKPSEIGQSERHDDEDEVLESADEDTDGFCKDDIYAEYLKQKYYRENISNHLNKNQKKSRAQKQSFRQKGKRYKSISAMTMREMEAIYYARSRMVGEMVPYFGGIPVVSNPMVEYWIRFFKTTGRTHYLRWLVRGETVREIVSPILKEHGLPQEFLYLSMIESGFNNTAYSRAKATGPWQFMQGTARLYGLNMNHWMDERRDPVKSTRAAAELLRDLYDEFGDWYLAMAAYNAGSGRIRSAIRKSGSKNFWTLARSPYLPIETKHYVPKMIAALTLAANPKAHGFEFASNLEDQIPNATVLVREPVRLAEIAQKLGVEESKIRQWNPELTQAVTPPTQGRGYPLRIPENLVQNYYQIEPSLTAVDIQDITMHKVKKGETLARIAKMYRISMQNILNVNPGLKLTSRLSVGKLIAIPVTSYSVRNKSAPKTASSRTTLSR